LAGKARNRILGTDQWTPERRHMSRALGTSKDLQKLIKIAEKNGFEVDITGNNHIKWKAPVQPNGDRPIYFCGLTASDEKVSIRKAKKFLIENGCPGIHR
jgi:hypothetical protein